MPDTVVHQMQEKKFILQKDGAEAVLNYEEKADHVLDLYSTFVPQELRGQGLAQKLAKAALEYAKENHFRVVPSCWFVEKYIERHQEYKGLLRC